MKNIKVLIVASGNTNNVFVKEQAEMLIKFDISIDYYYIEKKGIGGYLKSFKGLKLKIKRCKPDLIHAHFGLSGLLANLQRKIPVITTYHGCDINKVSLRLLSIPTLVLSAANIFVSKKQYLKVKFLTGKKYFILPCGINLNTFFPINKVTARKELNFDPSAKYVLFSSSFSVPVKNVKLALASLKHLNEEVKLIELDTYSREQVNLLMNACDAGLLTSLREGSPMFIKELLATNTPIVSTDVGDVSERINGVKHCYIVKADARKIAEKLKIAIEAGKTNGRTKINEFDNEMIVSQLVTIYHRILQ